MNDNASTFTLNDLNRLQRSRNSGGIIFVSTLLVVGLVGNVHVIAIFGWKFKQSNYRIFSLALAAIDTISCSLGMSSTIFGLVNPLKFHNEYLCKMMEGCNFFNGISSILLLLVVSIDRYRKVCCPFNTQIRSTLARNLVIIAMAGSLLVTWPAFVMFGNSTVSSKHHNISGSRCDYKDEYIQTKYPTYFNGFLLFVVVGTFVVYLTLYSLIGRKLWRHNKMRMEMTPRMNGSNRTYRVNNINGEENQCGNPGNQNNGIRKGTSIPASVSNKTIQTLAESSNRFTDVYNYKIANITESSQDDNTERETDMKNFGNDAENSISTICETVSSTKTHENSQNLPYSSTSISNICVYPVISSKNEKQNRPNKFEQMQQATKQQTLIFFIVALFFFLSYFPSVAIRLVSIMVPDFFENLSETNWLVFNTFLWTFFVNNVANPIIYCLLDRKYRAELSTFYKQYCCN